MHTYIHLMTYIRMFIEELPLIALNCKVSKCPINCGNGLHPKQQYKWISQSLCWMKEAKQKSTFVWIQKQTRLTYGIRSHVMLTLIGGLSKHWEKA